jgi:hypothetical protein
MNIRAHYIETTLEQITNAVRPGRFNVVEVGCMYRKNEGLSTYQIAKHMKKKNLQARFVSIDYESQHIDAAHNLLREYDESLLKSVEFLNGHSLELLPSVLEEMGEIHFAFLDGGAHPEICLKEFELIIRALSRDCACLVDDIQRIAPTVNYPGARPFGKGTLIYPLLIVADYLRAKNMNKHQSWDFKQEYESDSVRSIDTKLIKDLLGEMSYRAFGRFDGHAMLLYGNRNIIENVSEPVKKQGKSGKPGMIQKWYGRLRKIYSSATNPR